jgi:threonine/homoserine/homoserine lactone efflux protein
MLPTHHLVAFLLTVYVLILIPGPSVLFVVSRGVALGRRAALATVAGNASGFALQLLLVSIGIGSIVARSDAVFTTLKLLGAAYLVFLGVKNIRDRKALAALFAPAWAIASGTARQWLGRSSARLEKMTAAGGATLIALGVGRAVTTRRS